MALLNAMTEPPKVEFKRLEPPAAQREADPGRRQRITTYLDRDLYAEARGAAVLLAANGIKPGTVAGMIEDALAQELDRLRKRHNGGKPFPLLAGLSGGRPAQT